MQLYGIPQLWQIYTLTSIKMQKELISDIKKDEKGAYNYQQVLLDHIKKADVRYEVH